MRGRRGRPRAAWTKYTRPAARIPAGSGGRDEFERKVVGSRTGLPYGNRTSPPYYRCGGHLVGPRAAGVPAWSHNIVRAMTPDPRTALPPRSEVLSRQWMPNAEVQLFLGSVVNLTPRAFAAQLEKVEARLRHDLQVVADGGRPTALSHWSPKLVHAAGGHIERNSVLRAAFQSHGTTVQRHDRETTRPNDASCRAARVNRRAAERTA